jgi:hypothetical protein
MLVPTEKKIKKKKWYLQKCLVSRNTCVKYPSPDIKDIAKVNVFIPLSIWEELQRQYNYFALKKNKYRGHNLFRNGRTAFPL